MFDQNDCNNDVEHRRFQPDESTIHFNILTNIFKASEDFLTEVMFFYLEYRPYFSRYVSFNNKRNCQSQY